MQHERKKANNHVKSARSLKKSFLHARRVYLHFIRPLQRHVGRQALRGFKAAHKTLRALRKIIWQDIKKLSVFTHHHIAHRPHQHLMKRATWYQRWHAWQYHHHIHASALALFIFFVAVQVFASYRVTFASSVTNWDFSSPASFTLDSGVETSGSLARLKAQNYTSDANTAALYHFDHSSGSSATDSSANSNTGNVTGGTFTTGNLNNALSFNGVNNYMSAVDSSSLSFSQANTLEAWTKLSSNFSAGSTAVRQGVVDKGDYSLYYDNETGKLTYELANNSVTSWAESAGDDVGGSWDLNGKRGAISSTRIGSNLYVGTGIDTADAEVWMWNGTTWALIGGDGVDNSWADQTFEYVYALENDGTNIYAGLGTGAGDAEVWRWNGTTWSKIGGDGVSSSWAINTFELVTSMDFVGGNLYVGLGTTANDADVWRWNGTTWAQIGGDSLNSSWPAGYEFVGALENDGTNVYAGLATSTGDAEVWRWNGSAWSKIGGDGVNSSWNTNYETVRALFWQGSNLYAGLGDTAADAEVWRWNGSAWTQIGGDGLSGSWTTNYETVYSFAWDGTNLIVGLGSSDGDGEVYSWNGSAWTKIGGDGLNNSWATAVGDIIYSLASNGTTIYAMTHDTAGSGFVYSWNGSTWTLIGGQYVNNSWGYYNMTTVNSLTSARGKLYVGTGTTAGSALIWEYNGSAWSLVGGQGVNGSWAANTYENVTSLQSYNGLLVVGLGTTANDAEVWTWNGTTWTQIGGDSLNNGWAANYEEVNSLASYNGFLYAGLGNSANDAEVWRWNGSAWTKIGGDSLNSGWTTNYERVASLAIYNGELYAGLGLTAGDAEVWRWNGSAWAKVGGDSLNSGWGSTVEQVESMIAYNGKLYAGLGNTSGDAEVWEYNGSAWTRIGGNDVNGSWTSGTFETVRTLSTFAGDLYVGIGNSTGDGAVWKYSDGAWTKIGGQGANGGWDSTIEEVTALSNYQGKLYAGTGNTGNADARVWSWGNSGYLQSNTASFDTNWHHVAATYDGTTMRLYVDGTLDNSRTFGVSLPDSDRALLVGTGYGGREQGSAQAYFNGRIDELRISNIARSGFTTSPYSATEQVITLAAAVHQSGVWHWDNFTTSETLNGGTITYRLSDDGGTTWKYWSGSAWVTSSSVGQANSQAVIDAHISTFPVTFSGIRWQAILKGNGSQQVTLSSVTLTYTEDTTDPTTNAATILAYKANGGASLASNAWTNGSSPYFTWTAEGDTESGIKGYCAYVGTDGSADPVTTKGLLGASPVATGGNCQFVVPTASLDLATPGYLGTALSTSNSAYYLVLKAMDNAGNVFPTTTTFHFRFDNTPPTNPGFISAPSGFINTEEATLTWPTSGGSAAADGHSGITGLQYRIENTTWYGDTHTGTGDITDLLANDGSYTTIPTPDFTNLADGVNTIYFRTWDVAGNVTTTYVTAALKINTAGAPSEPQNLQAVPTSNTTNAFAFDWDAPATFVGNVNNLTYCYTINAAPTSSNCAFTSPGVTSLGSGPYATQPGANTFYVVARDESSNINYANYSSVVFTANTPSPGIPLNTDIVDVSIKATNNWRLALTWEPPTNVGAGIASYKVSRSTDNVTFSVVGSSSSTTYIDAGLSQQTYYYKIRACDSTNNCGADGTTVSMLPTGKFTTPASLTSQPEVTNVTTKRANISWTTDRASDSKIALGTSSGQYSPTEVGNSAQVTDHGINLDNLAAGTTYYFVAKWTDEDGNTATSQEFSFTTLPAPTLKEVTVTKTTLSSATIQFTSKQASKVNVLFGKSDAFGGLKTVNTSPAESTYSVELIGLDDGTKYFFRLSSFDAEGTEYPGNIFSFTTTARPRITNLRFQPVEGEPTSTQKVTWTTNVPSSSTLQYGKTNGAAENVFVPDLVLEHEIIIRGLEDNSEYFLVAQSTDKDGNSATSDRQIFRTSLDTRPPKVNDVTVESVVRGSGAEARGQVLVAWKTDEPATSQVAYSEGSNVSIFNNKTSEDAELTTEHLVIVSDLPTSKVYSIKPISKDRAGNSGEGEVQSAIIGRASDSVLTIILNTLQKIFGF